MASNEAGISSEDAYAFLVNIYPPTIHQANGLAFFYSVLGDKFSHLIANTASTVKPGVSLLRTNTTKANPQTDTATDSIKPVETEVPKAEWTVDAPKPTYTVDNPPADTATDSIKPVETEAPKTDGSVAVAKPTDTGKDNFPTKRLCRKRPYNEDKPVRLPTCTYTYIVGSTFTRSVISGP